jgi:two-component system chemotaxis response regulator CheB
MRHRSESSANNRIRVVVGEDSLFMRRMIQDVLNSDPEIEVVGTGANGREVLKKVVKLKPDCITLDLEMPRMDGFETLRYLMSEWPTPVIILSAYTSHGAEMTLSCLEYGAVDFVTKTKRWGGFPAEELINKVKLASMVDASKIRFGPTDFTFKSKVPKILSKKTEKVVLIGASTGGPQALMEIIPRLPENIPACVILVQHMPPNLTKHLASRLDSRSGLAVSEAKEGDSISAGKVLVAPGGMHLFLEERMNQPAVMLLERNELQRTACPSVDFALTSLSSFFKEKLIGVILTGMGRDGVAGSIATRRNGGKVICQDRGTSMIFGMPDAVIKSGQANAVCPLHQLADCIVAFVCEEKAGEFVYEG